VLGLGLWSVGVVGVVGEVRRWCVGPLWGRSRRWSILIETRGPFAREEYGGGGRLLKPRRKRSLTERIIRVLGSGSRGGVYALRGLGPLGVHAVHAIARKRDIRQVLVETVRPLLVPRQEFPASAPNPFGWVFPPSVTIRPLPLRRGWNGLSRSRSWVRLSTRDGAKVF